MNIKEKDHKTPKSKGRRGISLKYRRRFTPPTQWLSVLLAAKRREPDIKWKDEK